MADGDIEDPTDYGSIVRNNLMKRPGYAPYCMGCDSFDRMKWDGEQFRHPCGYRTEFPADFIAGYRARWHDAKGPLPVHDGGWLIFKAGRGWYRPDARGYTMRPTEAGRYSYADAVRHSHPNGPNGPRDGMSIKHESEVTDG